MIYTGSMQDLKQRFSRWYNRQHDGFGTTWAERFKSVMLQSDKALLACMVYVDLNSVRAGISSFPENYRYCGLSHYLTGGNASEWLDYESLETALMIYEGSQDKMSKKIMKLRSFRPEFYILI